MGMDYLSGMKKCTFLQTDHEAEGVYGFTKEVVTSVAMKHFTAKVTEPCHRDKGLALEDSSAIITSKTLSTMMSNGNIRCVSETKVLRNFCCNFVKSACFKFFSPLGRELNFQQNPYNISHHTLNTLVHYIRRHKNAKSLKIMHRI